EQPAALQDTCRLLESAGFSDDAIATFHKLVRWQNLESNGVDISRFPAPQSGGAYLFHGVTDFTNRLTHFFAESSGKPTFMCFDAAFLLLHSAGGRADRVENEFEKRDMI